MGTGRFAGASVVVKDTPELYKKALQFETWPIKRCIDYARNPRKNDHAVDGMAAAIKEFGFRVPIIAKSDGLVVDGHLRLKAAKKVGLSEVPVVLADDLTDTQIKALRLSVNKQAEKAEWDNDLLKLELQDLEEEGFDLSLTGFEVGEIDAFLADEPTEGLTDEDAVPDAPEQPVTVEGDVWLLGRHRLMCGDSTSIDAVERLMDGQRASLLHADPPYGMGKEGDGVANDNLYQDKLDAFQMEWWATFRTFLEDNASVYIWGNASELWRLWYVGGLARSERLTMRSQIIWDKPPSASPCGSPVGSDKMRSFPHGYETCLFFFLGEQGFNINADNYWEGWEPIRSWLDGQRKASGLTIADCNRICSKQNMTQSAFTKGGFRLILEEDYNALRDATGGRYFQREYEDLKREYEDLKREFYSTRAYFDNSHENMTDVWDFKRVSGADRYGHATPKPVAMMERVMRSSLPKGGLCVEPFGGSGSTLMGAEATSRDCRMMELNPKYCDVIVKRWQDFTGQSATLESTGQTFAELEAERNA